MDVDPELVAYGLTIVLGFLATMLGGKWQKAKDSFAQGQVVTVKIAQAVKVLSDAIEDDRITVEEEKRIVESWKNVIDEAAGILNTNGVTVTKKKTIKKTPTARLDDMESKIDRIIESINK